MGIKAMIKCSMIGLVWALFMPSPIEAQQFDWQEIELPEDGLLRDVAASPERLIAVGSGGSFSDPLGLAYTSTNGRDWQPLDIDLTGVSLRVVAFIRNQWLIGRSDGDLLQSSDGVNWSRINLPDALQSNWNSILEVDNEIWIVGNGGGVNSRIVASADLSSWRLIYENEPGLVGGPVLEQVIGSAQQLVGFARDPVLSVNPVPGLFSSKDGTSWDRIDRIGAFDILWNGKRFLAILFWEPPQNPIGELIPGGEWQFPVFTNAAEIRYQNIAANRDWLLLEGADQFAQRSIILSTDGGNSWVEQSITELSPQNFTAEIIAWQDGWVGVGNSIILGTPQPPQAVPVVSGWGLLVLIGLVLILSTRVFRRA